MKILVRLIKLYQKTPLNSHSHCRFTPTCSEYGIIAINEYGNIKGSYLTIKTQEALASKYQKQQLPFFLNLLSCNLKFYNIADFY